MDDQKKNKKSSYSTLTLSRGLLSRGLLSWVLLSWSLVFSTATAWGDDDSDFYALLDTAANFQERGYKHRALPLLFDARALADNLNIEEQIESSLNLGRLYFELGEYTLALEQFESLPSLSDDALVLAEALNAEANIYSILNSPKTATEKYQQALKLAASAPRLKLTITVNQLRHQLDLNIKNGLVDLQESALEIRSSIASSTSSSTLLPSVAAEQTSQANIDISLANLLFRANTTTKKTIPHWQDSALKLLKGAEAIAQKLKDTRLESYSLGYQGELLAANGKNKAALEKFKAALFLANATDAYESAYLWQWQLAKLNKSQGKTKIAITGYQSAITTLEHVRQELVDGSPYTFQQKVQPLFTELSDILLSYASKVEGQEKQNYLKSTQEILEQAKSAELEDYFQNECVIPDESINLNQIEAQTAVIYPVILKNRIEMLVNIEDQVYQFSKEITEEDLTELVNEFRYQLQEDLGDDEYLEISQELYSLLFEQSESLLKKHNIGTLLVIPDGVLRTIPMSAIHDGSQYMIEKYAVATTPGISLTLPKPFNVKESKLFAGGISDAVQGFVGLPGVPQELNNLEQNYGASRFQNEKFLGTTIKDQLSSADYSIVHIATHGVFDRNPQKSYLLTYDDKLTMDLLESSIAGRADNSEPLELLVLSACESAAGDSRAALGLAGVALKAGARSALATLWQISDAATVRLINDFYLNASKESVSKAEALQIAQINLINQVEFSHPSDWAPFLLIGNWL